MNTKLVIVATAIAALSTSAFADRGYQPESGSSVRSSTESAAQAGSLANGEVTVNNITETPAETKNTVEYRGTQTIKTVPSMVAPALTTTLTETCMGSSSAAISVAGFGMSGGTTWRDSECVNRLNARELRSMGYTEVACEVIAMNNEAVAKAFAKAGQGCKVAVQAASVKQEVVVPPVVEVKKPVTE